MESHLELNDTFSIVFVAVGAFCLVLLLLVILQVASIHVGIGKISKKEKRIDKVKKQRALDAAAKVGEQLATAARDHVARLDAVREASLEAAVAS